MSRVLLRLSGGHVCTLGGAKSDMPSRNLLSDAAFSHPLHDNNRSISATFSFRSPFPRRMSVDFSSASLSHKRSEVVPAMNNDRAILPEVAKEVKTSDNIP